jgi:competence protein ComEA
LVLLLILLLLHLLKPAPYRPALDPVPCEAPVFVQIEGEIRHPGVYALCSSPSLRELIQKAGGLRGGSLLPEDQPVIPNGRISVTKANGELRIQQSEISSFFKMTLGVPISVNTESEEGLTALPGIGKHTAKALVEERGRRGGFKSLDEVMGIAGIGPRVYARVKPYLKL